MIGRSPGARGPPTVGMGPNSVPKAVTITPSGLVLETVPQQCVKPSAIRLSVAADAQNHQLAVKG